MAPKIEDVNMATANKNSFQFKRVMFFGRNFDEYSQMFNLDLEQMKGKRILDCPSGPASFIAQAHKHGIAATGCDPQYEHDLAELLNIIEKDLEACFEQQAESAHLLDKAGGQETAAYKETRMKTFREFAADYPQGKAQGRYVQASLPSLPFADKSFDLVLSSNLLFLYTDVKTGGSLIDGHLDYDFHKAAVLELYRVAAKTVRIYPLKSPNSIGNHTYVDKLLRDLQELKITAEIVAVPYKDIEGANHLLQLSR
jgi:hypothetical protein